MNFSYGNEAKERFLQALQSRPAPNQEIHQLTGRIAQALLKGMRLRIQLYVMTFHSHLLVCRDSATEPHLPYLANLLRAAGFHVTYVARGLVVKDSV